MHQNLGRNAKQVFNLKNCLGILLIFFLIFINLLICRVLIKQFQMTFQTWQRLKEKCIWSFLCEFFFRFFRNFFILQDFKPLYNFKNYTTPPSMVHWNSSMVHIIPHHFVFLSVNTYIIIIADPFESMLQTLWSFTAKCFSADLLKTGMFSYIIYTGLNSVPPPKKNHVHLEPQIVTLFGNRISADAIS